MMMFLDIPNWMIYTLWFVFINLGVVVIAHLWLWFVSRLETRRGKK
tara:strand:- start:3114 stop:3251 length:138 start_codon:yes stop_codon:yes gene_type:complete